MAKTFSVLTQSAFQSFAARSGLTYTADQYGIISGVPFPDVSDLIAAGCNIVSALDQLNNLTATTDPGATNDNTQDYSVGSLWLNTSNSRAWRALSVSTGAAVWILEGVVPGVGVEPSNMITQFGSATGTLSTFTEEGNIYRAESLAGVGNAADTTDDVLFGLALPANAFDIAGRGLNITAFGQTAATTNNKRAKIIFGCTFTGGTLTNGVQVGGTASGGSVIADTGAWVNGTTPNSNVGWNLFAQLFKVGAAGSNTQIAQGQSILGTTHGGVTGIIKPTATESGIINIAVTGSSYTTGAASDILCNSLSINAMN